jgi:hypothetical protein
VLAIVNIAAVSKVTGASVRRRIGLGYWLRDGRIGRIVSYSSVEEAIEALGLPPEQ